MTGDWGFLVIWEFRVKPDMGLAFEKRYGPEGTWARFFRSGEGFVTTELIRDESGRYLTMDYWVSEETYHKFRARHVETYQKIDAECEAMMESEKEIGRFARVGEPGQIY